MRIGGGFMKKRTVGSFSGPFAPMLDLFVKQKQALGYEYVGGYNALHVFDTFSKNYDIKNYELTKEIVLAWGQKRPNENDTTKSLRIMYLQHFATFLNSQGYYGYIAAPQRYHHSQHTAYVFTKDELRRLFASLDHMTCVKLAALLHDIGKPYLYTTDETGHRHFRGFAKTTLLFRLNLPPEESKLILNLIRHYDMQLASTTNAVRRVKREYGADFIRKWAVLRQADRDDHVYPKGKNTQFYTDIEGILATLALLEYDEAVEARTFKPSDLAINGNDLIQELGFKEGPVIGTILHKLFEEVKAGKIKNAKRELLDESLCIFMKLPKETIGEQRQPDAVEVIDIDR